MNEDVRDGTEVRRSSARPGQAARAPGATSSLPRGRHGLSREQVEATQRLRLAVAMAEVCADVGFVGASVKSVLERAGVSRLTFYELYENKLDCFLDALDLVGAVLVEDLRIALDGGSTRSDPSSDVPGAPASAGESPDARNAGRRDPGVSAVASEGPHARYADRAVTALDTYLDGLADNLAFARLFIVEAHAAGVEAMRRRADLQDRVADGLATALGLDDVAGRFACAAFVGAVASVVTMPIVDGDVAAVRALRDPLVAELRALTDRTSGWGNDRSQPA